MPAGPFGTLTVTRPGIDFQYPITAEDVLWTARMIQGEAGGRADPDNYAVIWTMLNRYALLTNPRRLNGGYATLASFIRAYSTPLQPVLSYGSAKHHYRDPNYVPTGGFYKQDPRVPRGQLRRHLELQRKPWDKLSPGARQAAEAVLKGTVPNPIGLATEFANTATYFKRQFKRAPSMAEWREYNRSFGQKQPDSRGWIWIGDHPQLRQYQTNTFFVRTRSVAGDPTRTAIADLPPDTVRLVKRPVATAPQLEAPALRFRPAASARNCQPTKAYAQSGSCRVYECRITAGIPDALAVVPKELTMYKGRTEKLHPDALAAYQRMYAAASAQLPSRDLLKLLSGYRDYDTGAASWNNAIFDVFKMLGAQKSLPCLKLAIAAATEKLRSVPIPHAFGAWEKQLRSQLTRIGCEPDCDQVKVDWLRNHLAAKYRRKATDTISVAVLYKLLFNTPPGNSPHLTGRALDLNLGAPLSGDFAKLRVLPAFRWLVCNAERFGFHPYHVEPWHWEFSKPAKAAS
jgi:hypothetical protein